VSAIESFLHGTRRVAPSLDANQCRLGTWMNLESPAAAGRTSQVGQVAAMHQQLHACGAEILDLKESDRASEAIERLTQLHRLRDELLSELKLLLDRK
jgi:hypothetical protein